MHYLAFVLQARASFFYFLQRTGKFNYYINPIHSLGLIFFGGM